MTNYIVKNCPAYIINGHCALNGERDSPFEEIPCKNRTDCPIKQVVEIVERDNESRGRLALPPREVNDKILQTLQVEEVE